MTLEGLGDAWEAAWTGRDPLAFRRICASDFHYEDPLTDAPLRGADELADHAARAWAAFPDLRMESSGTRLGNGRFGALPVRVLGTHVGELDGLPPSNRFLSIHAVFWCELDPRSGSLWRVRGFFDAFAAGVDVGLLPKPGSLRGRALLMLQGYGLRIGR